MDNEHIKIAKLPPVGTFELTEAGLNPYHFMAENLRKLRLEVSASQGLENYSARTDSILLDALVVLEAKADEFEKELEVIKLRKRVAELEAKNADLMADKIFNASQTKFLSERVKESLASGFSEMTLEEVLSSLQADIDKQRKETK